MLSFAPGRFQTALGQDLETKRGLELEREFWDVIGLCVKPFLTHLISVTAR
jgi:hypothetical protein